MTGQPFTRKFRCCNDSTGIISWTWQVSVHICWFGGCQSGILLLFLTTFWYLSCLCFAIYLFLWWTYAGAQDILPKRIWCGHAFCSCSICWREHPWSSKVSVVEFLWEILFHIYMYLVCMILEEHNISEVFSFSKKEKKKKKQGPPPPQKLMYLLIMQSFWHCCLRFRQCFEPLDAVASKGTFTNL